MWQPRMLVLCGQAARGKVQRTRTLDFQVQHTRKFAFLVPLFLAVLVATLCYSRSGMDSTNMGNSDNQASVVCCGNCPFDPPSSAEFGSFVGIKQLRTDTHFWEQNLDYRTDLNCIRLIDVDTECRYDLLALNSCFTSLCSSVEQVARFCSSSMCSCTNGKSSTGSMKAVFIKDGAYARFGFVAPWVENATFIDCGAHMARQGNSDGVECNAETCTYSDTLGCNSIASWSDCLDGHSADTSATSIFGCLDCDACQYSTNGGSSVSSDCDAGKFSADTGA